MEKSFLPFWRIGSQKTHKNKSAPMCSIKKTFLKNFLLPITSYDYQLTITSYQQNSFLVKVQALKIEFIYKRAPSKMLF